MNGMNMGIDLSSVLNQAAQVTQDQDAKDSGGMKLLYPQNGVLKVRLLYNQPSGVVMRKFERHKINGQNVTCMSNYGQECPVCKMIDSIQNAKGVDLWKLKRTTRGIAYAEYVDSDYRWENPNDAPAKGEIVLLMFPWTIYTDLNRLISGAGQNIYNLIASNVGGVFKISRWVEKGQTKYRAEIDPFDQQHKTCNSDEEYQKLITELPTLNEKFVPVEPTDAIIKSAKNMADELNKEYLSPQVMHPNMGMTGTNLSGLPNQMPQMAPQMAPQMPQNPQTYTDPATGAQYELINNQWILKAQVPPMPPTPPAPPAPQMAPQGMNQMPPQMPGTYQQPGAVPQPPMNQQPAMNKGNQPACFGKHGSPEINPNQCLMCPSEAVCKVSSGR